MELAMLARIFCILEVILLCHGNNGKELQENEVEKPQISTSSYTCPRLVSIRYREYSDSEPYKQFKRMCHGTMVDRYWVAVSADCLRIGPNSATGNVLFWKVFFQGGHKRQYDVESIYIPKDGEYLLYTSKKYSYQIGFLKLREPGIYFMPGDADNCPGLKEQPSDGKPAVSMNTPYSNNAKRDEMSYDEPYGNYYLDASTSDIKEKKNHKFMVPYNNNANRDEMSQDEPHDKNNIDGSDADIKEKKNPKFMVPYNYNANHDEMTHDDSYGKHYIDNSDPNMTEEIYPDCPPDNNALGSLSWNFLHAIVAHFPDNPTEAQQRNMKKFMILYSYVYPFPCDECAKAYILSVKKNPPDTGSQEGLAHWLCNIHNEAKFRDSHGENPPFNCDRVNERWRDGYKDSACTKNEINKMRD